MKPTSWIELKNRPEIIFKFDLSPEVGFVDKVISFNNAIIYCTYNYTIFFLVHVHICTRVYFLYILLYNTMRVFRLLRGAIILFVAVTILWCSQTERKSDYIGKFIVKHLYIRSVLI